MCAQATVTGCVPGNAGPGGGAAGPPGGSSHCGQFDSVDVGPKEYVVQANEWNSGQTQCLSVAGTAFTVTTAGFALPAAGPPATYPSIYKGCHWGNCTSDSGLPVQVASLPRVPSHWAVTATPSGAYDIAYDLWFNKGPSASGQPNGTELMIWLDHRGGVQPAGAKIGTVELAGATWDVWRGPMPSWAYIAYVRQQPADSVDLDLRAFTEDSVARGAIEPSWYLIDIEAGFEIWQGGEGLATTAFRAVVGGA
jgi:hypothetical protein